METSSFLHFFEIALIVGGTILVIIAIIVVIVLLMVLLKVLKIVNRIKGGFDKSADFVASIFTSITKR